MNDKQVTEILNELEEVEKTLNWLDDKGIVAAYQTTLTRLARPFLRTLVDIAQSLEKISETMPRR